MEDKIIEIARFEQTSEAEMLANLLSSEGIECYVRDGISAQAMFGDTEMIGAKVELLEIDAQRALEIMKDYNYFSDDKNNVGDEKQKSRLAKSLSIIIILMIITLSALYITNKYFNG